MYISKNPQKKPPKIQKQNKKQTNKKQTKKQKKESLNLVLWIFLFVLFRWKPFYLTLAFMLGCRTQST